MKIKLANARILDSENMGITTGCVCIEGDSFSYVGSTPPEEEYDRIIDLKGNLIMPGLINAHTHSPMTFLRSYAENLPLDRWLNEAVFPNEAKLTAEDMYTLTKAAVLEYLTSGTTACFDMYFHPETMSAAFEEMEFRCVFCGAVNNFSESVPKLEDYYNTYNDRSELISYRLGFHAEYTTDLSIMEGIAALAEKYHAPVWCHSSETRSEVDGCISRYGMTPTELFDFLGLYNYGGGGFHCVHMTDNDIDIYRRRGLTAVTNPCSNLKLASGIAPLTKFKDDGVNIAIGTDGPASNNALDMFREMYLASTLQKLICSDAAAMPAEDVLRYATIGGAKALGLERCGMIKAGYLADFCVIDLMKPNMQPIQSHESIIRDLVYSCSKDNVVMTGVNGRILYENGRFSTGGSPEKIYGEMDRICRRIFS
ncbi:MAG: amidohydrolase family protein [Huintestinicola sp.]